MAKKAQKTDDIGKTIAIVSYLTWIGWIIALVLNMEKKNKFAKFHLRQSLLILIIGAVGMFIFWVPIIGWALWVVLLILWVIGFVAAVNGQEKEVPVIGKLAQDWFKGL